MKREFIKDLVAWKDSARRKPLIVTGVRQCGKTHSLKEFGSSFFENVCYINFESSSSYSSIFDYDFDVKRIIREIEQMEQCKITPGRLFLSLTRFKNRHVQSLH